jgi:triosephosphate isomerase (TIM)
MHDIFQAMTSTASNNLKSNVRTTLGKRVIPMLPPRSMIIIANWKMHGDTERVERWIANLTTNLAASADKVTAVLCPPSIFIARAAQDAPSSLTIGAQNCHAAEMGAYTGEISALMLKDAGARYVILGHSERRSMASETSAQVAEKARAADTAGLVPIVCIGETHAERVSGQAISIVTQQLIESIPLGLSSLVVAYEPVWAIGAGVTPTLEEITQMMQAIRDAATHAQLTGDRALSLVYGGSVNATNAQSIFALDGVDGALIGGASLDATQFASILQSASEIATTNMSHG